MASSEGRRNPTSGRTSKVLPKVNSTAPENINRNDRISIRIDHTTKTEDRAGVIINNNNGRGNSQWEVGATTNRISIKLSTSPSPLARFRIRLFPKVGEGTAIGKNTAPNFSRKALRIPIYMRDPRLILKCNRICKPRGKQKLGRT